MCRSLNSPTQFIRYEAQEKNNQNHARTIIGSNRNGSENWNSDILQDWLLIITKQREDFAYLFGDTTKLRHSPTDEG